MKKIDRYIDRLGCCIEKVESAIEGGAILMDSEKFDFYFKKLMYGKSRKIGSMLRDEDYRLAYFYAKYFREVMNLRAEGYSNKMLESLVKNAYRDAALYGMSTSSKKVNVYDWNNVVYLELIESKQVVHQFEVKSKHDLTVAVLAVVTYLGTRDMCECELKELASLYLSQVFEEVMEGKNPIPYVYKGKSKTLRSYFTKSTAKDLNDGSKVIKFKIG